MARGAGDGAARAGGESRDRACARRARHDFVAEGGVHYLLAHDPPGPYPVVPRGFPLGDGAFTRYAGRLVEHAGRSRLMTFRNRDATGAFPGGRADPVPLEPPPRDPRLAPPRR